MTRVFGQLFDDGRDGILCVKPSKPFFGCDRDEQHINVVDGAIDCDLLPTPRGVTYLVGFKKTGDTRRTNYTLRWLIPDTDEVDVTPGAKKASAQPAVTQTSSLYERVQLKRVAGDLTESLSQKQELAAKLSEAEKRVHQLEDELREFKKTADIVLADRDEAIAQLSEKNAPVVKTVYLDKPVPPKALHDRIHRLEQENLRLIELNSEYYKSVVDLYQLQLDKARNSPQVLPVEDQSSPQKRLLRKLLGK